MAGSPNRAEAIPRRCPIPSEKPPARLEATLVRPDQVEDLLGAAPVDPVGQGQAAEVIAGAAAGMERLGVEQGADLEERAGDAGRKAVR